MQVLGSSNVYNTLYDWQKPFVDQTLDKPRWGFFLDMGIGKTKISVSLAELHNSDLVIATSRLSKVQERDEPGSFADELQLAGYQVVYGDKLELKSTLKTIESAMENRQKLAIVTNHHSWEVRKGRMKEDGTKGRPGGRKLALLKWLILQHQNVCLIFDESHALKDRRSGITKEVQRLINGAEHRKYQKNIKHVYLLTGTPWTVGYVDLFSQLKLLGLKMTWGTFEDEFIVYEDFTYGGNPYDKPIKKYKNKKKLFDILEDHATFALTEAYYENLPKEITTVINVRRGKEYELMANEQSPHYRTFGGYEADTSALFSLRLRQLASGYMGNAEDADYFNLHKYTALRDLLTENENNYVIFYTYEPEMHLIQMACEEAGYVYDTYNGSVKESKWYFNEGRVGKKALIANTDAGGESISRQKYNSVIFFSLPDTWAAFDQACHRIYRIGQESATVFYYILKTVGTIEHQIWNKLKRGENYTQEMFEDQMKRGGLLMVTDDEEE